MIVFIYSEERYGMMCVGGMGVCVSEIVGVCV